MDGLYFDDSPEPDEFIFEFNKDMQKLEKEKGISYIRMDYSSENDFYDALYEIQKFNTDRVKCYATSRDGHYDILVEAETDSSDATPSAITPPTTANKRSRKKVPSVERKKMEEELNESIEE